MSRLVQRQHNMSLLRRVVRSILYFDWAVFYTKFVIYSYTIIVLFGIFYFCLTVFAGWHDLVIYRPLDMALQGPTGYYFISAVFTFAGVNIAYIIISFPYVIIINKIYKPIPLQWVPVATLVVYYGYFKYNGLEHTIFAIQALYELGVLIFPG